MTLSQGLSVCSGGSSPALLSALSYNNKPQDIQTHFSQQYKESSTSSGCNSSPLSPALFIHSCICAAKRISIIYHLLSSIIYHLLSGICYLFSVIYYLARARRYVRSTLNPPRCFRQPPACQTISRLDMHFMHVSILDMQIACPDMTLV